MTAKPVVVDAYLPLKALAQYSGLSVRTLRSYLVHAVSPLPYYRVGGRVLVKRSEFDAWTVQFRVTAPTVTKTIEGLVDDVLAALG